MSRRDFRSWTLRGGALGEEINIQLGRVIENLADPNTPWKAKRTITVEIGFVQDEKRQVTEVAGQVKTKLPASVPIKSNMAFGRNKEGKLQAVEIVSNPGQIDIFGKTAPVGNVINIGK